MLVGPAEVLACKPLGSPPRFCKFQQFRMPRRAHARGTPGKLHALRSLAPGGMCKRVRCSDAEPSACHPWGLPAYLQLPAVSHVPCRTNCRLQHLGARGMRQSATTRRGLRLEGQSLQGLIRQRNILLVSTGAFLETGALSQSALDRSYSEHLGFIWASAP